MWYTDTIIVTSSVFNEKSRLCYLYRDRIQFSGAREETATNRCGVCVCVPII
jgi:hypothetical protein